eukprot:symbB.v1.2.014145.t1/scaffold1025.1/size143318/5
MSLFGRTVTSLFSTCEVVGKARSSIRTQAIEHSSQPEWNYERQLKGFKEGDSLVFKVLQDNNGKDQPLMSKTLKCQDFYPYGFAGELLLDPVDISKTGPINPDNKPILEVLISDSEGKYPKMMLSDNKLEVRILSARNLPSADVYLLSQASSDPYCKLLGRIPHLWDLEAENWKVGPSWERSHIPSCFWQLQWNLPLRVRSSGEAAEWTFPHQDGGQNVVSGLEPSAPHAWL